MEKYPCPYCGKEFDSLKQVWPHTGSCKKKRDLILQAKEQKEKQEKEPELQELVYHLGENCMLIDPKVYEKLLKEKTRAAELGREINGLKAELERLNNIEAVTENGKVYWPIARLPKEVSYLLDGQFLKLECVGRIRGSSVEIEDAKLL